MITNFKFQIIPSRTLYPEYPTFDFFVRKKVTGMIWTDEEFTWSCNPGYIRENMGSVDVQDYTDDGGKCYSFDIMSRPTEVFNQAINPCYGILNDIPKNFPIGSKGFAIIHLGGANVKKLLRPGKSEAVLYSDWQLISVY
jgi:hypothetical protein